MVAEATDLIEKAVKEAPDAKLGRTTIVEIRVRTNSRT